MYIAALQVSVCGRTKHWQGRGVVHYSSLRAEQRQLQVRGEKVNRVDVLNMRSGVFRVPQGAEGDYLFRWIMVNCIIIFLDCVLSFSVTIDSFDIEQEAGRWQTKPSKYVFNLNGHNLLGSNVYSDVGWRLSEPRMV